MADFLSNVLWPTLGSKTINKLETADGNPRKRLYAHG